ncbi:MAG: (2Fe-2S)-binding protein [Rhodocyclales bacterium]|nr:(2Fe-2S)-binding protein [Rhodocyclales bacterium]
MYICVCRAITERDIGSAVAEGCCNLRQLREQTGLGACCGRCTQCARDVLKDALQTHAPISQAPARFAAVQRGAGA